MTNTVMGDGVADAHDLPRPHRTPLSRIEAAQYLRDVHGQVISPSSLAWYASVGGGPFYRRAGKFPLYEPDDLDDWALARRSPKVRSHSEFRALAAKRNTHRAMNGEVST